MKLAIPQYRHSDKRHTKTSEHQHCVFATSVALINSMTDRARNTFQYQHTVIFGVGLAAVEHTGYCYIQPVFCPMLGLAVVPAKGEVLDGGHHKEVGTLLPGMLLC